MTDRTYASAPVRAGPELGRDGVRAEERRDDVDRAPRGRARQATCEEPDLGLEVQAVAGLGLDGRDAVAEHLVEPASPVREQRLVVAARASPRPSTGSRRRRRGCPGSSAPRWRRTSSPSRDPPNSRCVCGSIEPGRDRRRRRHRGGRTGRADSPRPRAPPRPRSRADRRDPALPAGDDRPVGGRVRADSGGAVGRSRPGSARPGRRRPSSRPRPPRRSGARARLLAAAAFDDPERRRSPDPSGAGGLQAQLQGLQRREVAQPQERRGRREPRARPGPSVRRAGAIGDGQERGQRAPGRSAPTRRARRRPRRRCRGRSPRPATAASPRSRGGSSRPGPGRAPRSRSPLRLDLRQPAAGLADAAGDPLRQLDVARRRG